MGEKRRRKEAKIHGVRRRSVGGAVREDDPAGLIFT
jgi:hypothetical protein